MVEQAGLWSFQWFSATEVAKGGQKGRNKGRGRNCLAPHALRGFALLGWRQELLNDFLQEMTRPAFRQDCFRSSGLDDV